MNIKKIVAVFCVSCLMFLNFCSIPVFADNTDTANAESNITNVTDQTLNEETNTQRTDSSFNEAIFQSYLNNDMDSIMNFLLKDAYIYNYSAQHKMLFLKKEYENINKTTIVSKIKEDFASLIEENDKNSSNAVNSFINEQYKEYIDYLNKSEDITDSTYTFIEFLMKTDNYKEWATYLSTFKTDILEVFLNTYVFGSDIQTILNYTINSKDTTKIDGVVAELQKIADENGYAVGQLCASIVEYYTVVVNNGMNTEYNGFDAYFIIEKYNFDIADKICNSVHELNEYDSYKDLYGSFSNISSYDVFMQKDINMYHNYLSAMNTYSLYYKDNINNKYKYYQLLTDRIKYENKQINQVQLQSEYKSFVEENNKLDAYYENIYKIYAKSNSYTDKAILEYSTKINTNYKILHPNVSEYVKSTDTKTNDTNEYRVIIIEKKANITLIVVIIVVAIIIISLIAFFIIKTRRTNQYEYYD